jgi:hypothetical protein
MRINEDSPMITLRNSTTAEISQFGRNLFLKWRDDTLQNFEQAAQAWAQTIYETFREPGGNSTFALVRMFRIDEYAKLPPTLRAKAKADWPYVIALAGTYGDEVAWCARQRSNGHQVLDPEVKSPMVWAAIQSIGLTWGPATSEALAMQQDTALSKYFYVPDAIDSPYVPAQDEFVLPYGIKSVIGFGIRFLSNCAYMALCFSKVPLVEADVEKFVSLLPFVSTSLAAFDGRGALWT